jgi:hypothetical protein
VTIAQRFRLRGDHVHRIFRFALSGAAASISPLQFLTNVNATIVG